MKMFNIYVNFFWKCQKKEEEKVDRAALENLKTEKFPKIVNNIKPYIKTLI
jgi:hypothetical protein